MAGLGWGEGCRRGPGSSHSTGGLPPTTQEPRDQGMGAVCLQPSPLGCSRACRPFDMCVTHTCMHMSRGGRGTGSGWLSPGGAPPACSGTGLAVDTGLKSSVHTAQPPAATGRMGPWMCGHRGGLRAACGQADSQAHPSQNSDCLRGIRLRRPRESQASFCESINLRTRSVDIAGRGASNLVPWGLSGPSHGPAPLPGLPCPDLVPWARQTGQPQCWDPSTARPPGSGGSLARRLSSRGRGCRCGRSPGPRPRGGSV